MCPCINHAVSAFIFYCCKLCFFVFPNKFNTDIKYFKKLQGGGILINTILFEEILHFLYDFLVRKLADYSLNVRLQPIHVKVLYTFSLEPHNYQHLWQNWCVKKF